MQLFRFHFSLLTFQFVCGDEEEMFFWGLLQHFALAVVFEYAHLLNGYLVEPYQTVGLRYALIDEHSIEVFHIRSCLVMFKK